VWRRKDEKAIIELINKQSEIILETVRVLVEYLDVILRKKPDKRLEDEEEELAERVLELESKADRIEEEIDEKLQRTALPVTSSERYSMIEKMDSIADRSEIIVRKLRIIEEPIPLEIKERLCEMGHYCLEATDAIVKSIQFLSSDFDSALTEAQKVRPIRNQNRTAEFETLRALMKHKMKTATFVLLHDIVQLLGRLGDRTNEVAHVIISLIIKYRQ
jgi:uncharacterized protein Yka (UPF0111/DUF47 family)